MHILVSLVVLFLTTTAPAFALTCPRGTFKSADQCIQCSPGTFQNELNATSCEPCRMGSFFPFSGAQIQDACVSCPEDTFSAAGAAQCTPCPPGTTSAGHGSRCAACPPGTFFLDPEIPGVPLCTQCQPGTFSDRNNSKECTRCPPGTISPAGATSGRQCTPCPPGTVSEGDVTCTPCQSDLYYNRERRECRQCEVGTNLTQSGCQQCPPGYFGKYVSGFRFGEPRCIKCPDNFTTFGAGATQCRRIGGPCPEGYAINKDGDCVLCPVDFRYDVRSGKCMPCPVGTGSNGGTVRRCTPCVQLVEQGLRSFSLPNFVNAMSMSECFSVVSQLITRSDRSFVEAIPKRSNTCAPGTRTLPGFPKLCAKCPSNTFSNINDVFQCTPCPLTHFTRGSGSTECTPCPEGSQRLTQSDHRCIVPQTTCKVGEVYGPFGCERDCGNNNANPVVDTNTCGTNIFTFRNCTGCETCPNGFVRGAFDEANCLCRGSLAINRGIVKGSCVECPPGSFGSDLDADGNAMENNICKPCPKGTFARTVTMEELERQVGNPRAFSTDICQPCPVNTISQPGSAKCEECQPGTFSYGLGETECIPLSRRER